MVDNMSRSLGSQISGSANALSLNSKMSSSSFAKRDNTSNGSTSLSSRRRVKHYRENRVTWDPQTDFLIQDTDEFTLTKNVRVRVDGLVTGSKRDNRGDKDVGEEEVVVREEESTRFARSHASDSESKSKSPKK